MEVKYLAIKNLLLYTPGGLMVIKDVILTMMEVEKAGEILNFLRVFGILKKLVR
jgi:hypothetical protein